MTFFESRWLYYLFGQVWIWCRRKWMWAFYPFEKLVFINVLKILLINIWIFIPLLIYMWGVEGVTSYSSHGWICLHPLTIFYKWSCKCCKRHPVAEKKCEKLRKWRRKWKMKPKPYKIVTVDRILRHFSC